MRTLGTCAQVPSWFQGLEPKSTCGLHHLGFNYYPILPELSAMLEGDKLEKALLSSSQHSKLRQGSHTALFSPLPLIDCELDLSG